MIITGMLCLMPSYNTNNFIPPVFKFRTLLSCETEESILQQVDRC